jgi:hypothetical protein
MITGTGPIARDPARRLARNELSKGIYHQTSVPQEIWHAITGFFGRIFHGAGEVVPGGWWTLVALAALVAVAIALVAVRLGPVAGGARRKDSLTRRGGRPVDSRRLREAAETAAAAGDYATAIVQRLRAVAAGCEERGVLGPDAGRTADEFAALGGARYPGHGAALAAAALLFDQVRYGDSPGTRASYERLRDLDDTLSKTTPTGVAGATAALAANGTAL